MPNMFGERLITPDSFYQLKSPMSKRGIELEVESYNAG